MLLSAALIANLEEICGPEQVISDPDELIVYECDAYPLAKQRPPAVVFPTSTAMAVQVMHVLAKHGVAFVPRGAGTSLAGGCLSDGQAVSVSTARMRRVLEIDLENECIRVEAGVVTQAINDTVQNTDYYYAPDPSSQITCTIGGNVANNAGGPHTLKYGVTGQHILALEVVLSDGELLTLGSKHRMQHGYDLKSLFIGSEGTLGLITEVTCRLMRKPSASRTILAVYASIDDASNTVTQIIAHGHTPAALEMMDQAIIRMVEGAYSYGFPLDAEAVLIIELDGLEAGLDTQLAQIEQICLENRAKRLEHASTAEGRALLWKARKSAFGTLGRAAPNCITQDGVVPRSKLPDILRFIRHISNQYGIKIANNFHAGDGNIHPNLLFDGRDPLQTERALRASQEILAECVRLGGSVTGEHGIGVEKKNALHWMYNDDDLRAQQSLRLVFDRTRSANPNKVFGDITEHVEFRENASENRKTSA